MLVQWVSSARRKAETALVDGFFRTLATVGRLHPGARPERHGVEVLRDLPYLPTGRVEHRLDVYRPSKQGPWPVLFYVHGGSFRILSKDTHWLMGLAFARKGFVVFNISYRLAPEHPFPAAVQDTFAAYAWMLDHAASYGGDPSRLVVAGESAGANLALGLTLSTCDRREESFAAELYDRGRSPDACIAACGIHQVSDIERFHRLPRPPSRFIMDRLFEVPRAYLGEDAARPDPRRTLADPLLWVEKLAEEGRTLARPLPPMMLPVGTADPLVDDTRRLERALRRLGVECTARYYDDEHHAFHAFMWREAARRCWRDTYAFVDELVPRETAPDGELTL